MSEKIEILTKVYGYINTIKVFLAIGDIDEVWKIIGELNEYLISIDCNENFITNNKEKMK